MKITLRKIWDTKEKHNLTNEEFLSMCRSNDFNPFDDKETMKLIITVIATGVVWDLIRSTLMDYKPNKNKP